MNVISIRTKLFVLIVLANTLMVAGLMALNSASFSRSFSDYVAAQEARRLEPLLQNIALTYESQGDWSWLRWESEAWASILRDSFAPRNFRNNNPQMMMPPTAALRGYLDKIVIKDAKTERVVFGRKRSSEKTIWLPVRSSREAKPVAYFGFEPSSRLDSQFDRIFAKQQQQQLLIIGLFGVLVAAALAIPFSGWLVRPIQHLTNAVRTMTQGDLTVSVKADRQDELGQLGRDFNRLAEVLTQNAKDRQQWVSDIAHELRTPIAIFLADIEAAQDGVRSVDEDWLAMMHQHVSRLTRLVNDLHQLSQSDSGTLSYRFDELNLIDVINNAVHQFEQSCVDCFIDPHWQPSDEPVLLLADDSRLNQLFSNLAQNTLRYTDGTHEQHGHLRIYIEQRADEVDVIWEDSSPGVGDNDLSKLFDRLYRVDESRSRESGGSGLGLAIVKNIVEAHQGHIRAEHSDLGGLKIIVTFKTKG